MAQATNIVAPQKYELTDEIIAGLKAALVKEGLPDKLYRFTFGGKSQDVILFRPLLRDEWEKRVEAYKQANPNLTQDQWDERICSEGLVWPADMLEPSRWGIQPAGYQPTLSANIQARSGFIQQEVDQADYMLVEPLSTVERGPKPDAKVIEKLKAENPWPLRLLLLGDEYFIYRPINRAEYKLIHGKDEVDPALATCQRATLWSKEYPEKPNWEGTHKLAGVVNTLYQLIMLASGTDTALMTVEEL